MKRFGMEVNAPPVGTGSFARSVLTLMTGTTLANLIPIATSPALSRLYSPSDFGLFALYAGVAALLAVAATGRYEMAIVLPAEDADAMELLGLSLLLAAAVAVVSGLAVAAFHPWLLALLRAPALAGWLWLLPFGVLLMGVAQALGNWLNRKRAYRRIATSRIAQAVTTATVSIALARTGLGAGGLIVGAIAGQAVATTVLSVAAWQGLRGGGLRVSRQGMRRQAGRYREFPRVNAFHALVDNLNASATVIVLAHCFDTVVVGHYSMVMRVLTAPVALIGSAITQVFYQRAADLHNRGEGLTQLMKAVLRRSVWIALPAALALLIAAPTLFTLAFGPDWAPAGFYARLLSPYMFFYFLAAPLAFVPFVLDKQVQSFFVSTTGNLLSLACIAIGGYFGAPAIGFGALSAVQAAFFVFYIGWMLRIAARPKAGAA
jgi:O-antigen/teichoic acid export membrane protein